MQDNARVHALGYVLLSRAQQHINADEDLHYSLSTQILDKIESCKERIEVESLQTPADAAFWVNFHWRYRTTMYDI